ncbi:MAG: ABC transporter permease subunit [Gudongella sp.]|nr:ABC transporter permease subunit [Gudongella sp.]
MRDKNQYKRILAIFICFLIIPLGVLLIWSFSKNWSWPNVFPSKFGLRGWEYFFDSSSNSINILFFSICLSLVVTFFTLIITIPAAKALSFYEFKGKKIIELLIYAPIIVPPVAVAMGIHFQFIKIGLANTFIGVVLVHIIPCIPYSVRILKSVFELMGRNIEEEALDLGANRLQCYIYITLPLILPGVLSAGSIVFIVSFSQYFLTFLIGGGRVVTFSMLMFPFIQSGDRMIASVYSIVFIVTTVVVLFIVEKMTYKFYRDVKRWYL